MHRTYDPATGRYLEVDPGRLGNPPAPGGFLRSTEIDALPQPYQYALNDPLSFFDPFGDVPKPRMGPRYRHRYVYTGASPENPRQSRFPKPQPTRENCETAREILEQRLAALGRAMDRERDGFTPDPRIDNLLGLGGGIDELQGNSAWIRMTSNRVRNWNRAEHESSHLFNPLGGESSAIADELARLRAFLAECKCANY